MKIKTFGAKHYTGQLPRIEDGFKSLGHEIVETGADLIYCNNPPFTEAIKETGKKIFNILDIPLHVPEVSSLLIEWQRDLKYADKVTCISKTVQKQIQDYLNIDADVIYNPIKDVKFTGEQVKAVPFLYVGRANDRNKRFHLVVETLKELKVAESFLLVVGTENPGFGQYLGMVDDNLLTDLYNSALFVLLPSKFEGIGLPGPEALVCKTIPILCNDNPTATEFIPADFIVEPNPVSIAKHIRLLMDNYGDYRAKITKELIDGLQEKFDKVKVAERIVGIYNGL